ncbi:MAG: DUF2798 domain-containing protein [Chloroflexota bacterium]
MKISEKQFGILMGTSIGGVMSFILSFIMLYANAGFVDNFLMIWMQSFAVSFVISTPIALVAFPVVQGMLRLLFIVES